MMRERWMWKAVNCLYGFGWRVALAEEMLVHFSSILKDPCLAHRLRALIPRRHLYPWWAPAILPSRGGVIARPGLDPELCLRRGDQEIEAIAGAPRSSENVGQDAPPHTRHPRLSLIDGFPPGLSRYSTSRTA
jgi:hypothetical protein